MNKRIKYKAISMVFMSALSSMAMFTSLTAAWFTTVRNADAAANTFVVKDDDALDVDFEVYEYDEDNLAGRIATDKTVLNENGQEVLTSKFALPQYDSFIPERNVYNNKILRIEIKSKDITDSNSRFTLNVPCRGSFLDNENMVVKNMSNIIAFKYFFKHELPNNSNFDESTPETIYKSAYSVFETINDSKSYVTLDSKIALDGSIETVGTKVEGNTIVFADLDIDEKAEDATTVMYLEYFYKDTLVDYYFDNSRDEKATADKLESYSVSFVCDITKLQFGAGGANR